MFHRQQGQIAQKSNKEPQKQQSTTYTTAPQVNGAISAKLIQRAKDDPSSLSSDEVLALQETMGNRAVSRLLAQRNALPIQAKLTIGEPGDKYEQEADRIASVVVNQINSPVALNQAQTVQREMPEDKDKLQTKSLVQREMPEDKDKLQTKTLVQREYDRGVAAPAELESSIQQARSGGQPLADNIRKPMEQAFGANFSRVKVHTDAQADQLNQSIQAKAFTTGQDVFFRQGEYNPGSRGRQELIADELTQVVQQNGGAMPRARKEKTKANSHIEVHQIHPWNKVMCSWDQLHMMEIAHIPTALERIKALEDTGHNNLGDILEFYQTYPQHYRDLSLAVNIIAEKKHWQAVFHLLSDGRDHMIEGSYTYKKDNDVELVPIYQIEAPTFRLGNIYDDVKIAVVLEGIKGNVQLPPVVLNEARPGSYKYTVTDGIHRYYASVKLGFKQIPAIIQRT